MRTGSFIALVGITALGLSGCASIEKVSTASGVSSSTGSGVTSSVDTESATGSDTGTSTGQSNSTGSTSYVSNDGGFNIAGNSLTEVTVANSGGGIGVETATVSVNTGLDGLTWADTIEMALFRDTVRSTNTNVLAAGSTIGANTTIPAGRNLPIDYVVRDDVTRADGSTIPAGTTISAGTVLEVNVVTQNAVVLPTAIADLGATDGLNHTPGSYPNFTNNTNFSGYKEYRTITSGTGSTSGTDAELQIWSYQYSNIGQYTVFNDPSAGNNNNVSLFFDGSATPTSGLPAGSATYSGKFGGTAVVSNYLEGTRTFSDPFDSGGPAGTTYDPNGTWRVVGDTSVTADFGSGAVTGAITNTTWRKFTGSTTSPDGFITVTPNETSKPFRDYTFTGTITDNTFAGNAQGPAGSVVTGNNAVNGGFFGPNAEEVAGIISVETTSPSPSDGVTTNEANRRGSINLRGVFQGTR
ncbi:MAG TPA: hypothetical protein ENJ55_00805 [Rhizobiales bacterium]|nr:hypothetical protein [Hyphomicrobiales bacterium]